MKIMWAVFVALGLTAPAEASCRFGHCYIVHHARRVRAHGSGRVISNVPPPLATRSAARLHTPTFTERPVQPGQAPLPAYLPNNAPPVFAPQPIP